MRGRQFFQPGILVGSKDAVRGTASCKHVPTLEDDRILVVMDGRALRMQGGFDSRVARQGGRVVIVVEKHGTDPEFSCQSNDLVAGHAMPHDKPAAPGLQGALQFGDAGMNELDPPIGRVGERIQDVAVEYEHAGHLPGALERVIKRSVIEIPQVAAKPHQGAGIFRHGARWSL